MQGDKWTSQAFRGTVLPTIMKAFGRDATVRAATTHKSNYLSVTTCAATDIQHTIIGTCSLFEAYGLPS
jgi:hypothetical protein